MNDSRQTSILVSAIVPARNEEGAIAACVQSLAVQPEIGEILVVNDQSTDATASIVKKLTEQIPQLRLLETGELPPGWVGKNNAVWLGARKAQGQWLLFTDADAVHEKDSAAKAVAIAAQENAAMISFSPEQVMETWYEKSLIPYIYCRLANKFSYSEVNNPGSPAAAANGQFLLIRRDAYQAVGGHASVAGKVLEDVALAKRVKDADYRIWFGSGKGIVRTRMYRTFGAMWEGWKKNLYPLMGKSPEAVRKEFIRAVVPVHAVMIAAITIAALSESVPAGLGILVAGMVGIFIAYDGELKRSEFPSWLVWYGVPGRLLFGAVLRASYRCYRKGKLEWKGREYPAGTPDASK
jgi:glycosyltransferase involved in cell wall biosynthesis